MASVASVTGRILSGIADMRSTTQEKHALYLCEDALRSTEYSVTERIRWIRSRCDDIERGLASDTSGSVSMGFRSLTLEVDKALEQRRAAFAMLAALLTEPEMKMLLAARRGVRVVVK